MTRKGSKVLCRALATAILPLAASRALFAQTSGSWIVDADGSWSNAANWSSNPSSPGAGGVATFGLFPNLSALHAVTLDPASVSLSGLSFDSEIRYLLLLPGGNTTNTISLIGPANLNVLTSNPGSPSLIPAGHLIAVPLGGSAGL